MANDKNNNTTNCDNNHNNNNNNTQRTIRNVSFDESKNAVFYDAVRYSQDDDDIDEEIGGMEKRALLPGNITEDKSYHNHGLLFGGGSKADTTYLCVLALPSMCLLAAAGYFLYVAVIQWNKACDFSEASLLSSAAATIIIPYIFLFLYSLLSLCFHDELESIALRRIGYLLGTLYLLSFILILSLCTKAMISNETCSTTAATCIKYFVYVGWMSITFLMMITGWNYYIYRSKQQKALDFDW